MKKGISLFWLLSISVLFANMSQAVELQARAHYDSGEQISVSSNGFRFSIPDGWFGGLGDDGNFYMLSQLHQGSLLVTAAQALPTDTLLENLSEQPLDLGEGLVLYPQGEPQQSAKGITQRYATQRNGVEISGYLRVRMGQYNVLVTMVAVGTQAESSYIAEALDKLSSSVEFFQPKVGDVGQSPGGSGDRGFINQSQNGSVVSGRNSNGQNCTFASAGGTTFKVCD
jgi:hypothetical protein